MEYWRRCAAVRRSAFGVRRSAFGVRRSAFPAFGVPQDGRLQDVNGPAAHIFQPFASHKGHEGRKVTKAVQIHSLPL